MRTLFVHLRYVEFRSDKNIYIYISLCNDGGRNEFDFNAKTMK